MENSDFDIFRSRSLASPELMGRLSDRFRDDFFVVLRDAQPLNVDGKSSADARAHVGDHCVRLDAPLRSYGLLRNKYLSSTECVVVVQYHSGYYLIMVQQG